WRTEGRIKEYWTMYTLNDGLAGTVATTLIDAAKIYRDKPCADAAKRLGDFLILAQLPEPQPAWAQQYNYAMQPIWARRFEPPAVTGGESQDAIETLMTIYRVTGDEKYLQPIPAALAYLRKSLLDDGRLARYYELQTNKPLYMNRNGRDYYLTHDDRNLPDHYGWKIVSRLDELAAAYERCRAGDRTTPELSQSALEQQVRTIIANLDDQDRWMSVYDGERLIGQPKFAVGDRYLSSQLFSDNLETLSRFLKP
ncbi:MAG: pectic acid lyase, partial [Planctomycetales bacterium]|nr:pectic acid lyase [Planctomycetales bacterium]